MLNFQVLNYDRLQRLAKGSVENYHVLVHLAQAGVEALHCVVTEVQRHRQRAHLPPRSPLLTGKINQSKDNPATIVVLTEQETETRPPTQSQKPKTFSSAIPNSAVLSSAELQATMCSGTASCPPARNL